MDLPTDASPSGHPLPAPHALPSFPGCGSRAPVCGGGGRGDDRRRDRSHIERAPGGDAAPETDRGAVRSRRTVRRGLTAGRSSLLRSPRGWTHMRRAIRLRRALVATLILTAILTGFSAASANAATLEST